MIVSKRAGQKLVNEMSTGKLTAKVASVDLPGSRWSEMGTNLLEIHIDISGVLCIYIRKGV